MAALVWAVAAMLSLSCVSGQVTNSLAGQTPIVTNGAVLPDNTFVGSTWAQVAGEFLSNVAQSVNSISDLSLAASCMQPKLTNIQQSEAVVSLCNLWILAVSGSQLVNLMVGVCVPGSSTPC